MNQPSIKLPFEWNVRGKSLGLSNIILNLTLWVNDSNSLLRLCSDKWSILPFRAKVCTQLSCRTAQATSNILMIIAVTMPKLSTKLGSEHTYRCQKTGVSFLKEIELFNSDSLKYLSANQIRWKNEFVRNSMTHKTATLPFKMMLTFIYFSRNSDLSYKSILLKHTKVFKSYGFRQRQD